MTTPINEIYPFAENAIALNILDNADYLADAQRLAGHQMGIGRQELENAVLRNLSRFCHGLAQFIAENYTPGVVDDGDASKIVAGMTAAVEAVAAGIISTVAGATTVAAGIARLATEAEVLAGEGTNTIVVPADLAALLAAALTGVARIGVVNAYTRQQYSAQLARVGQSGNQAVDLDLDQALAISATGAITMDAPSHMAAEKTCTLRLYSSSPQPISWNTAWHGTSFVGLPTVTVANKWLSLDFVCFGTYMVLMGMAQEV